MRSRKLLALIFSLLAIAPALAGYMTLLGAGVGSIQPVVSWVSTTDPTFPSSSLTYSGPSLSTMFDSTGKLTYKPNNLLTYGGDLTNAAWTKSLATITSGVSDPVGGTAAFTYTATANGSIAQSMAGVSLSGQRKFINSVWLKRRTGSGLVRLYNADATPTSITLTASWQQFFTVSLGHANTNAYFQIDVTTAGDAVDIYLPVTAAVTYETTPRTADQVITASAAYYGPRIDYDPNTLAVKGLLIEEARTNLALQSNTMVSGWSGQGVSSSTDGTLWLDGATAQKRTTQATTGVHSTYSSATITTTEGNAYSASWNVKAGTYSKVYICAGDGTRNAFATFDISGTSDITASQASGASHTSISGSGKYLGNGWFRLTLNFTAAASASHFFEVGVVQNLTGNTTTGFGEISWTAAGTETYYIGQPQYEVGAFPTSFIPTAASSVTRAADAVQFTGAALTALQGSAGSVIIQSISEASSSPAAITNVIKGTNSILYRDTTGKVGTTNGTTALLTAAAPTWSSAIRNGLAWSASGRSLGYTSGSIATDANTVSNGGTLYLGSSAGSAVESGWYQSFGLWNQRLPDATLSTKLTVGGSYAANDNVNPFAPQFAANDNLPVHWRIAL